MWALLSIAGCCQWIGGDVFDNALQRATTKSDERSGKQTMKINPGRSTPCASELLRTQLIGSMAPLDHPVAPCISDLKIGKYSMP